MAKKQGRWQEVDTLNYRIVKECYYLDNQLDGPYIEYKRASADTLIFGNYKNGRKYGVWKYWDPKSNSIEKMEDLNAGDKMPYYK